MIMAVVAPRRLNWRTLGRKFLSSSHRSILTSLLWEKPHQIHHFLQKNIDTLSAGDIATIFFTSAKRKYKLDSSDIYDMAKALEKKDTLRALTIANILNGLRIHTAQDPGVMYLLTVLKSKLDNLNGEIPPRLISLALLGFKQMNNNQHTLSLLESLTNRIESSPSETIPPSEFGNTLFGLQNFTSEDSRVISLLDSLQYFLEPFHPASTSKKMTSRSLAQSLYGLKGMSWNHQIVRNLYQLLLPHIIHCHEPFDRIQLGTAFYGLQKYPERSPLCCEILTVLGKKLSEVTFPLDGATIGSTLYGLQNLSSESPIVLSLLRHLTPLIATHPLHEKITSQSLGSALYGLRNMSNSIKEVADLVVALEQLIPKCVQIQERQGSIMLIGLRRMNAEQPSVRKFLEFIYFIFVQTSSRQPVPFPPPGSSQFFEESAFPSPSSTALPTSQVIPNQHFSVPFHLTAEVICKCLHSFQRMSSDHTEVVLLLQFLVWRLEANDDPIRSKDIGLSIYGLQRMHPFHPVVKRTFAIIASKLQSHFQDQYLYPYDIESAEITFLQMRKTAAERTHPVAGAARSSQGGDEWREMRCLEEIIQRKRRKSVQTNRY
jgi:hypothetical protein